ncbi:hypothetical protein ABIB35_001511 [Arthrobacter sp. UYP6]|uniref:DUF6221 family protein n=1 Tax=Arthrobacter sp. UYP6 TaxID=1756378 RepID=UPI0033918EFD
MTITEFLLARIAEDEAVAMHAGKPGRSWRAATREAGDSYMPGVEVVGRDYPMIDVWDDDQGASVYQTSHIARHDPARVQAECTFKRWLIGTYSGTREAYVMFRAIASVYSEHPDYREEWAA